MRTASLIFCVGMSCSAVAQTTWQGLEFGADRQKISETLASKQFLLQPRKDSGTADVIPDFELQTKSAVLLSTYKAPVAEAPTFFRPELGFDTHGQLETVKLYIDPEKSFQVSPALRGSLPVLTFVAGTSLYEQLTSKYGAAATKHGPCENIPLSELVGSITQCSARWNSNNQSIELFWEYNWRPEKLIFLVTYSKVSSSL
jgi:hypothetical protein